MYTHLQVYFLISHIFLKSTSHQIMVLSVVIRTQKIYAGRYALNLVIIGIIYTIPRNIRHTQTHIVEGRASRRRPKTNMRHQETC